PPPTPAQIAARIVNAQRATDGASVTDAFMPVQGDFAAGDDASLDAALRVIEEIAVLAAQLRPPKPGGDELRFAADHLDPLLDRAYQLVRPLAHGADCPKQLAAAPAASRLATRSRASRW